MFKVVCPFWFHPVIPKLYTYSSLDIQKCNPILVKVNRWIIKVVYRWYKGGSKVLSTQKPLTNQAYKVILKR